MQPFCHQRPLRELFASRREAKAQGHGFVGGWRWDDRLFSRAGFNLDGLAQRWKPRQVWQGLGRNNGRITTAGTDNLHEINENPMQLNGGH